MIKMIVYSVYDINRTYHMACEKLPYTKWNTLLSYYYYNKNTPMNLLLKHSEHLLFDSGAFSLLNGNHDNINFDSFLEKYISFIKKYHKHNQVTGFIELDIGKLVGYEKVLQYRKQLENITNKIIPVWHTYLGIKEYKQMIKNYDYVAIGGIVNKELNKKYLNTLNRYAIKHNTKIHALGMGDEKYLKKIPFYSVDHSSYNASRWGGLFLFRDGTIIQKRLKNKKWIHDNMKQLKLKNYLESIKMQQYYKTYWDNKPHNLKNYI